MSKRSLQVSHFMTNYPDQILVQKGATMHVLLWHDSGSTLSHWAFKGSSNFAAQATCDKIKLAHFHYIALVFLAAQAWQIPLREVSAVTQ